MKDAIENTHSMFTRKQMLHRQKETLWEDNQWGG